ncbi:MAG: zinc-binding dehydrogenase [Armatimonadetes bacterium]|nr:zinc-binding dehydrogenase [Armatimonadota bacterium]
MKAAQIVAPKQVELVDVPEPVPGPGEVLVRVTHAGVCGSDLPLYGGEAAQYPLQPGAPGHELIGELVDDLADLPTGQRVLVAKHNGYAQYVVASREKVLPLEEDFPPEQLLLTQPLGTVIHGLRKLPSVLGWEAIVVGCGPIGLLFIGLLRQAGCRRVVGVDPLPDRLARARAMGADETFQGTAEEARAAGIGEADLAVEAVGVPETLALTPLLVRRAGWALLFGVPRSLGPDGLVPCDLRSWLNQEVHVVFSHGPDVQLDFGTAHDVIVKGVLDVTPVISHVWPFERIAEALALAHEHAQGTAKIVLVLETDK